LSIYYFCGINAVKIALDVYFIACRS